MMSDAPTISLPLIDEPLSVDSPVPLYHQLEIALRQKFLTGALPLGAPLPTEAQLQEAYGVSRSTVRKAIEELVQAGLIVKRHGVGTFVAEPEPASYACLSSFTAEALRQGRSPGTEVLEFDIAAGREPGAHELGLGEDDLIVFVKRLRLLDRRPVFLASSFVPRRIVPDLTAEALEVEGIDQSLYHLMERHGVAFAEGEELTTAVRAGDEVAEVFGLTPGESVVKKSCLLRNRAGVPVIYEEAIWGIGQTNRVKWQRAFGPGSA